MFNLDNSFTGGKFTLANYSVAFGELTTDPPPGFINADTDVYSLGELYQGNYVIVVSDLTWDSSSPDYGNVTQFSLLDSYGVPIQTKY